MVDSSVSREALRRMKMQISCPTYPKLKGTGLSILMEILVLFRGLAIADPDKLENEGQWSKELFRRVKDMGATLVRIPGTSGSMAPENS